VARTEQAGKGKIGSRSSGGERSARRPGLNSRHFSLTWRRNREGRRDDSAIHRAPRLMLAVAKKLLPRAIDRNTVRRIAREAWRAAEPGHRDLSVFIRLLSVCDALKLLPDAQRKRLLRAELDGLLSRLPVDAAGGAGGAERCTER
jgi:RNase P protein component